MVRYNNYSKKERDADSKWEARLRDGILEDVPYHVEKIKYHVKHSYEPDWSTQKYVIEAKGRFRETSEAAKYKWIREVLQDGRELVFLFMKPSCPMPHAKRRKDGTKQTHAEWAEKNGFRWFTEETIKEIL